MMNFTLRVWRQNGPEDEGRLETYQATNISSEASFLEMLDIVNNGLEAEGREPIVFEHDCREGICGSCGMMVNGRPHGPGHGITTCQLYMHGRRVNVAFGTNGHLEQGWARRDRGTTSAASSLPQVK
jgi:succinate dehydrogenase/fumarate reductase-like Fe-S protein